MPPRNMIPLARPVIGSEEITNVLEVLKSGMLASGTWVNRFETEFAQYVGTTHAIATTSGTVALDLALKAVGIAAGDEVLIPDFTFIATANAVLFQRARPVFVDVDERTFTINPEDAAEKVSRRTKAVLGVHLFGHPFDVRPFSELCADHHLHLIEDCAQAHGAEYRGKRVGVLGDLSCFSFYGTKNMTTGEGGMITTADPEIAARIRLLINHGQSQKYLHTSLGYNYRMTDLQAALGVAQLQQLETFIACRIANAHYYSQHLRGMFYTPCESGNVRHVYHQYVLTLKPWCPLTRDELISTLSSKSIGTAVHYPRPIHLQPLYQSLNYVPDQCPIATRLAHQVISLPVHPALTTGDTRYIVKTVNAII